MCINIRIKTVIVKREKKMESQTTNNNMEEEYDLNKIFIDTVLNDDTLKTASDELCEPGCCNLITHDWQEKLHNNPIFVRHRDSDIKYYTPQPSIPNAAGKHLRNMYIADRENKFQLLVVGTFRVVDNKKGGHCIQLDYSKPIEEVANVMIKDENIVRYNNCKFYMVSCSGLCRVCYEKDDSEDKSWCIGETKILTPNGFQLVPRSYCASLFKYAVIAIVRLEIDMKYYFGTGAKVGGKVKSIIFVPHGMLRKKENITDVLSLSKYPKEIPNVEPQEDVPLAIPRGIVHDREEETECDVEYKKIKF